MSVNGGGWLVRYGARLIAALSASLLTGTVGAQIGNECADPSSVYASAIMIAPAPGSDFYPAPQPVTLTATSDWSGATVNSIWFYTGGGAFIGSVNGSSGSITWNGLAAGSYSVYAVPSASPHDLNCPVNISSSAVHTFTVSPYVASTVSVGATGNGSTAPSTISLSTTISGRNPISSVAYLANGSTVASNATAPYNATWSNVPAGTYNIQARASDIYGGASLSGVTTVVIAPNPPPAINLTVSNSGTSPATIGLTANASDPLGINRVEFLSSGVIIGTDTTSPYSLTWANVPAGTHSLQARATNNYGTQATTSAQNATVQPGNKAQFVSQSVPASMNVGQSYPVSVTFKNTGVTTWTTASTHMLGSQNPQDNVRWGLSRVALPGNVAPGANVTFNFNVTGPATGSHNFQWRMLQSSVEWFGDYSTNVAVISGQPPPPTVSLTAPQQGAVFGAPASVTLTAAPVASAGVARVEFYVNGVLKNTDTASPYTWLLDAPQTGSYSLKARVYDAVNAWADSATVTVTVQETIPIVVPNTAAPLGGSLSGAASVGTSGAASYAIPINAPPGTAGVVPSLAFNYASQGGAGLLGIGWGMSGLSAIIRCPRTVAQDGVRRGVDLNANDRYCLDGQRLILVSGTYGGNGAEYRTEIDTFAQVKSFGTDVARGPDRWEVRTKSGLLMHYGNTADSLVEAQGRSPAVNLKWALARVQDVKGNYWSVAYDENTAEGEHYPRQISYTGNSAIATPLVPYAAVRFVYTSPRSDPEVEYVAGAKVSTLRRLSNVQTFVNIAANGIGGTLTRDYRIQYSQSSESSRSLVQTIQDCDGSGNCLPTTSFAWQQQATSERHFNAPGSGVWGGPVAVYELSNGYPRRNVFASIGIVDLNGDGKMDMLKSFENGTWQACLSTGSGFDCQTWAGPALKLSKVLMGDFNGDGRTDLIYPGATGAPWQTCLSTGTAFNCISWPGFASPAGGLASYTSGGPLIGDFNGDGRDDIVGNSAFCYSTGSGFSCQPFTIYNWSASIVEMNAACPEENRRRRHIVGDFDDDGRPDYLVLEHWASACPGGPHSYTWQQYSTVDDGTTRGFVPRGPAPGLPTVDLRIGNIESPGTNVGQVNPDAYADFVLQGLPNNTLQVCRTTGTGFACSSFTTASYGAQHVGDFDGDGRADSFGAGGVCQLGVASTFACATWTLPSTTGQMVYGDFNGDGKTDLAIYNDATSQWSVALAGGVRPDLLSRVTNGIGDVTEFSYKPLTDSSVHTRDTLTGYPQRDVIDATPVVTQVRASNGIGGWLTTDYRYGGMKTDLTGRGALGFRWMEATDQVSRVTTRTEFAQTWPYTGMVQRQISTHVSAVELSRIENTLVTKTGCSNSGQMPFNSTSVATTKDLNGASLATVTNSAQIDCFGNPTNVTATTVAGAETYSTSTVNAFDNAVATWRIGEMRCTRNTRAAPGITSVTRTVGIDYDSLGLVLRETVEPKSGTPVCATADTTNDLQVKADYTRDVYGNVLTKTLNWTEVATVKSRKIDDFTYDAKGRFPLTVKNALNQTETRVYSDAQGQMTSLTGPNALTTTWQYDSWGRRTKETRADTTFTNTTYKQCQSSCNGGALAVIATPNTGVSSVTYIDAKGRDVRYQTWASNGTEIVTDREHNSLGRLARVALKRLILDPQVWTTFDHDDLGRVWRTTDPDGVSTISFNGLDTTYTNAKSQTRRDIRNGLGKLRQVFDHNNQSVTYRYEPFGNLERTTDAKANKVVVVYDRLGRKTSLTDPNLGNWTYKVNPIGELLEQVDPVRRALSQKTTMTYDGLGRLQTRVEPDMSATWTYDTCTKGIGKVCQVSGTNSYLRKLAYDALGRLSSVSVNLDGTYISSYSYNAEGRVAGATHTRAPLNGTTGPAQAFNYVYNSLGFLKEVKSGGGASYWRVEGRDAFDRVTREVLGNNLVTRRVYHPSTTRLTNLMVGPNATATVQNDAYLYDALGNVDSRTFLNASGALVTESFTYDALNRLKTSAIGAASKTYNYDELGNLTSKSGIGSYAYPASGATSVRPHAVSGVTGTVNGVTNPVFTYDTAGNLLSGAGRTWTWSGANRPNDITQGALKTAFVYGPERQRVKQTLTSGASTLKTIFYAGAMQKEIAGAVTTVRTYLPNDAGVIIEATGSATQVRYFHRDRLGSVVGITNETGGVVERLSYDAWGKRRNADGSDAATNLTSNVDDEGYTGHEMLDDFGLVHMNGRVYDPALARMTSSDPYVPEPDNLQSFNRYAYVVNNPLVYTDPSGFCPLGPPGPNCNRGTAPEAANNGNAGARSDAATVQPDGTQALDRVEINGTKPMRAPSGAGALSMATVGAGAAAMRPGLLEGRMGQLGLQVSRETLSRFASGLLRAATPWTLLIMPSSLADGTLSPEMRALILQSSVNADDGQNVGDATAADQSGADSEDQGGDQAKDSKRRFDKGQRDRAVDNARDDKDEPRCSYCGQKLNDQSGQGSSTEIDHVKAHSRGGKTTDDNAAATCRTCNRSKGAKDLGTEWVPPTRR